MINRKLSKACKEHLANILIDKALEENKKALEDLGKDTSNYIQSLLDLTLPTDELNTLIKYGHYTTRTGIYFKSPDMKPFKYYWDGPEIKIPTCIYPNNWDSPDYNRLLTLTVEQMIKLNEYNTTRDNLKNQAQNIRNTIRKTINQYITSKKLLNDIPELNLHIENFYGPDPGNDPIIPEDIKYLKEIALQTVPLLTTSKENKANNPK